LGEGVRGRGEKWPKHCMHIWIKEKTIHYMSWILVNFLVSPLFRKLRFIHTVYPLEVCSWVNVTDVFSWENLTTGNKELLSHCVIFYVPLKAALPFHWLLTTTDLLSL
jgi:hypothetical protein